MSFMTIAVVWMPFRYESMAPWLESWVEIKHAITVCNKASHGIRTESQEGRPNLKFRSLSPASFTWYQNRQGKAWSSLEDAPKGQQPPHRPHA